MKRFLTLSAVVAVAGLAVGIIGHQKDSATVAATVALESTTTTSTPTAPPSTTAAPAKKVVAARASTTSTIHRPVSPAIAATQPKTTATTAVPPAPTAPTTSTPRLKPTCTVTPQKTQLTPGELVTIQLTSNMPNVGAGIKAGSMGLKWQQTDAAGSTTWQIAAPATPGRYAISTGFRVLPTQQIGSVCGSSITVAAS